MLKWLFGAKDAPSKAASGGAIGRRVELRSPLRDSSLVHVRELDFFGHLTRSPNDRFALLYREGNYDNAVGQSPERGLGHFYLLDSGVVVAEGTVARPHDGKVANNGTFILNDWHSYAAELSGTFLAYRVDGSQIVARRFEANLFNNGLAESGSHAVCQTCNAPNEDGSRLSIFDLEAGLEVGGCAPESGWASEYAFPDAARVRLIHRELGGFDYALDGNFLDRQKWIEASLKSGAPYLIQRMLKEAGDAPPPALLERLLEATNAAAQHKDYGDARSQALILKLRGTCLDELGRLSEALDAYEKALALDPKIGVKRRVEQLRKAGG